MHPPCCLAHCHTPSFAPHLTLKSLVLQLFGRYKRVVPRGWVGEGVGVAVGRAMGCEKRGHGSFLRQLNGQEDSQGRKT